MSRALASTTVPWWSTARTPSSSAVRIASVRARSRASSRQALLLLVRGVVDDARQLAQLVVAPDLDAGLQVPGRELPRRLHRLLERPRQRAGESQREEAGREQRQRQRQGGPPEELPALVPDPLDPAREAGDADDPARGADGHGRVQEVGADGVAVPLDGGGAAGERLAAPRDGLPWLSRASSAGPESAESARTRPSGAMTVTRALTSRAASSTTGSSASGRRPAGERVLDDARHQARLRQQRGPGIRAGAGVQPRPGQRAAARPARCRPPRPPSSPSVRAARGSWSFLPRAVARRSGCRRPGQRVSRRAGTSKAVPSGGRQVRLSLVRRSRGAAARGSRRARGGRRPSSRPRCPQPTRDRRRTRGSFSARPRKDRAGFACRVAHRHHQVPGLARAADGDVPRHGRRDVDPDLGHRPDRERVDAGGRPRSGGLRRTSGPPSRWLTQPSAICERQELPVQRTRTRFRRSFGHRDSLLT